jgi:hypothetical protein
MNRSYLVLSKNSKTSYAHLACAKARRLSSRVRWKHAARRLSISQTQVMKNTTLMLSSDIQKHSIHESWSRFRIRRSGGTCYISLTTIILGLMGYSASSWLRRRVSGEQKGDTIVLAAQGWNKGALKWRISCWADGRGSGIYRRRLYNIAILTSTGIPLENLPLSYKVDVVVTGEYR